MSARSIIASVFAVALWLGFSIPGSSLNPNRIVGGWDLRELGWTFYGEVTFFAAIGTSVLAVIWVTKDFANWLRERRNDPVR